MSDGDLLAWIRYLHAAAAVPKGDPDYADAQAAVQHAVRKIRFLNRQANRADITTPDAYETARMSALANTAGDLAAAPVAPALTMTGGPGFAQLVGPPLEAFLSKIASKAALNARGVDVNAYERGMEAHPTATAVGEMVPPVLLALAGRLGAKPAGRFVSARLSPSVPGVLPPLDFELTPVGTPPLPSLTNTPPILSRPVRLPSFADPLDWPTFLRRGVP